MIGYVGRLDPVKGLETLIQGFSQFFARHGQAHLVIAGKSLISHGDYGDRLRRLVNQLGLDASVTFLGHSDQPSLIYQASDITVVPSLWPEPFGRTLIEAMACGTPVVASAVGGMPEILTGPFEANLFPPGDAAALTDRLLRLVTILGQNPDCGSHCRRHVVDNFSIQRNVDGIEACFKQALASE
ncbi:MAG: glycosyltransferase family 4 protein [Leptolyngbyaceae cyanobacterium SM2_3_12]|nr:glycosyltransferase family 4 protein [Leptolyngbyaceae cyanobacterium SM2_3_12]